MAEKVKWANERLAINAPVWGYFDTSSYTIDTKTTVDYDKVDIKPVTKEKEIAVTTTNEVQKTIEQTKSTSRVELGRWDIQFDPDTNLLKSRGKTTKIDSTKLTMDGLSITFVSLKELIMAANLINMFKDKYPGVKDFEFRAFKWTNRMWGRLWGWGIYNWSTRVITLDAIKADLPSILDADNNITQSFIDFINKST